MGAALLRGWRERGLAPSYVVDPSPDAASLAAPGVTVVSDAATVPPDFHLEAVVLAVKPQIAAQALPAYARFSRSAVYLSIMAGKTIAGLTALLGESRIVRAMPNTPAAIGRGITVACRGPGVTDSAASLCGELLGAAGSVEWVEDEALLDAVTAVSGSGPAYVFLLAEALEQAAIAEGLPAPLARRLARETIAGSGALMLADPADPAALRQAVTSPRGTTAAALAVLMVADGIPALVQRAVRAAAKRSRELAG
jgi:pyrroline-5-carboxylate reductase